MMGAAGTMQLLNLKDVRSITKLGRTTIYRWMDQGKFPKPIKLSDASIRWRESDLERWIAERESQAA
jgi:prophage regulatory protein